MGGLTFLVLLVLKLTRVADVSWFWVTFPLWVGLAFVAGLFASIGLVFLVAMAWDALATRRRRSQRR